jgi:LysM repeat protein
LRKATLKFSPPLIRLDDMTEQGAWLRFILLTLCLSLAGCLPSPQSRLDEEKEPHFLAGRTRAADLDYKGAIECYEKSLESNPRSAAAHFELAWIYHEKENDPAAAIFHYQQFLKLHPHAHNEDLVKEQILRCKGLLAQTVSFGPVTQVMQREFERLQEDNKTLRAEVEKWRTLYTNSLRSASSAAAISSRPPPDPTPTQRVETAARNSRPVDQSSPARGNPATSSGPSNNTATAVRTHTIQPGETPTAIARNYGIKVELLMAANPRLDPRRMKPGQLVNIPAH